MTLTVCRECGAALPPQAYACPKCGTRVGMAPESPAAYRPAPPRPPEEPKRRGWATAAGWVVVAAVAGLFGLFLFRLSEEGGLRATERAEVAREQEHLLQVNAWMQDTSTSVPLPESAGRPVPTSERAKRMWVMGRMLVDRPVWERKVMERHGVKGPRLPAAWGTPRYAANARAFPEVERYVEGRVAAIAEIEKTSAAWLGEYTAALARESGMPAAEIRDVFPRDFRGAAVDYARHAEAMRQVHRHLVRVDPRVSHAGGKMLQWEREEDLRRLEELTDRLREAALHSVRASEERSREEAAALNRWIE